MNFWTIVNRVIRESDIIIEVLDARFPELSRNEEIEKKVLKSGKKILFVVNKADLINIKRSEQIKKKLSKTAPTIFISAKKHYGTSFLREAIMRLSKGEKTIVGILGYPNTGKSSLINSLRGRQAAKTSSMSGFTKSQQKIRVSNKIMFFDTPGVYSYQEKDEETLFVFGAIDYTKVKDPESTAYKLIEMFKERIKKHYGLTKTDTEELIDELAIRKNKFKKGNEPDTHSAAKELLQDWQKGKII